jgi:endonuclease/exonuclease/phosphatase family metal-dependent hydrolase
MKRKGFTIVSMRWVRRLGALTFRLGCFGLLGVFIVPWAMSGASQTDLQVHGAAVGAPQLDGRARATLRVMSLNLAHGRRDGRHQALLNSGTIRENLADVVAMLRRETPDLVALQEADGTSCWSGRFDHVGEVARQAGFDYFIHGYHVRSPLLRYGTAIVSRNEPIKPISCTFSPSPPTLSKGFVCGTYSWPGDNHFQFDLVSVHLDYASPSVRAAQVGQMIRTLRERGRPMIVLGDFNCDFRSDEASLRTLADELRLEAYEPQAEQPTFPSTGERLDWILISRDFEFVDYRVLPDVLSDHAAITAELRRRGDASSLTPHPY